MTGVAGDEPTVTVSSARPPLVMMRLTAPDGRLFGVGIIMFEMMDEAEVDAVPVDTGHVHDPDPAVAEPGVKDTLDPVHIAV